MTAQVIVMANHLSHSGKTIGAVNLAATLAASEFNTLVIDLDPLANAGAYLGVIPAEIARKIEDVLVGRADLGEVLVPSALEHLKVLPSSCRLLNLEVELMVEAAPQQVLRQVVRAWLESFDYIVIDTPSAFGMLTINALAAAQYLIVPVQASSAGVEGLAQFVNTVELVRQRFNPELVVDGIMLNQVDRRSESTQQVIADLRQAFTHKVFEVMIPTDLSLVEAASYGRPVLLHHATGPGALSFLSFTQQWLKLRASGSPLRSTQSSPRSSPHVCISEPSSNHNDLT